MKKINSISTVKQAIIIMIGILAVSALLVSCAPSRWYKATGDGCQQSAGMTGYGNKH